MELQKKVNVEACVSDAVYAFQHGFACSEAVIYAMNKHYGWHLSDDAIAMSSGFPWGLGGGGCICGALAGGTMCLGFLYGRRQPDDPKITKCFEITKSFHDAFKIRFGATCCRVLIHGMERNSPERKAHCTEQVEFVIRQLAALIAAN